MSHADGLAILPDGESFYFEYNGTSDICCTRLYREYDELHDNWRNDCFRECTCNQESTPCMLSTNYGARWHFLFPSTICINCLAITGKLDDNEY